MIAVKKTTDFKLYNNCYKNKKYIEALKRNKLLIYFLQSKHNLLNLRVFFTFFIDVIDTIRPMFFFEICYFILTYFGFEI